MSIASKLSSPNIKHAAIYYFHSAFVVTCLTFCAYLVMKRVAFFKYCNTKRRTSSGNDNESIPLSTYLAIAKSIFPLLFAIWLNMFSTLAIFPVYNLGVVPNENGFLGDWFHDVVTFATFNIFVTVGNLMPRLVRWPGPKYLPYAVGLRALCVFLFFSFSNYMPNERTLPVFVSNDYVYWFGCAISPLLFGYFTSLLMMYTPQYDFIFFVSCIFFSNLILYLFIGKLK